MIEHAQTAKAQGITQQYQVALSGLKMILSYQKRCKSMILQIQMTESMRDLTTISSKFVKIMGDVGTELTKVNKSVNFAKNQLEFEKGMMAAENAMSQLEDFMEDAGMSFEDAEDDQSLDEEVANLIDATGAAKVDAMDAEIDSLLAEIQKKNQTVKE
ncbi:MAG: hypothetical protein LIO76_10080 [Clostridiales bacterium]|nr:hypothetical protein [Clostridiales bacterium]